MRRLERLGVRLAPRPSDDTLTAMRVLARCHALGDQPLQQVRDVIDPLHETRPAWRKDLRSWLLALGLEDDWTNNSYRLFDTEHREVVPALPRKVCSG